MNPAEINVLIIDRWKAGGMSGSYSAISRYMHKEHKVVASESYCERVIRMEQQKQTRVAAAEWQQRWKE